LISVGISGGRDEVISKNFIPIFDRVRRFGVDYNYRLCCIKKLKKEEGVMNDIVIKSGDCELRIQTTNSTVDFNVWTQDLKGIRRLIERHVTWLSEEETPEQWLGKLADSNPESDVWIGQAHLYLGNYRNFHFGAYDFERDQIREAIKAALLPEKPQKPRIIFKAENGKRYEWGFGTMREVE